MTRAATPEAACTASPPPPPSVGMRSDTSHAIVKSSSVMCVQWSAFMHEWCVYTAVILQEIPRLLRKKGRLSDRHTIECRFFP